MVSAESTTGSPKAGYLGAVLVASRFVVGFCLVENGVVPFCPTGARVLKNGDPFVISRRSLSRVGEAPPEAEGLCAEVVDEVHIPFLLQGTASEDGLSWADPEGPVGDVSSDPRHLKSVTTCPFCPCACIYSIDEPLEPVVSLFVPSPFPITGLPHILSLDFHRGLLNEEPIGCVALSVEFGMP